MTETIESMKLDDAEKKQFARQVVAQARESGVGLVGPDGLPAADAARQSCLTLTHPVLLADADEMATIAEALAKTQRHAADLLALPQGASTWAF